MQKKFFGIKVQKVVQETADAVSVLFDIPSSLQSSFQFTQGQYLTLQFKLNGKEVRRAYSMSSSPIDNELKVTIKRIKNGLVSNHVFNNIKAGNTIQVMPPQGRFFTPIDANNNKSYYLFGGGSGITPLMSILKTVLAKEPQSKVFLFYGNQNEESIIFKKELDQLGKKYASRLVVEHILDKPKMEKPKGLFGFMKKPTTSWEGRIGLANAKNTTTFLQDFPPNKGNSEYFICGPGPMMDAIEALLIQRGVDKQQLHLERFSSSLPEGEVRELEGVVEAKIVAYLDGERIETIIPKGETILDVLLKEKHDVPYSCTTGACSTCLAKCIKGEVKMKACLSLEEDEIAEGLILTCQSCPTTEEVEISYEV